jgi:hypothetical protein
MSDLFKTFAEGPAYAERAGCIGHVVKRPSAGNQLRLDVEMPRTNRRSHQPRFGGSGLQGGGGSTIEESAKPNTSIDRLPGTAQKI